MKRLGCLLLMALCLGLCSGCGSKVQVTVKVVDDNNQPVPDARVTVMGLNTQREGRTDKDGLFPAKLRNVTGQLDLVVKREGFYTIGWYSYYFVGQTNRQWQPWNPLVELQLHRLGKPTPMVVKQVEEYLPALNEPVGYDLLSGDWVRPYGKGLTNDFIFKAERRLVDDWTYSGALGLSFSHPTDGLIRVSLPSRDQYGLRLAAQAPLSAYSNVWAFTTRSSRNPSNGLRDDYASFGEDDNFYFRVRTQTNRSGEVIAGMYGKVYWGIRYAVGDTNVNVRAGKTNPMPWLHFLYYLNPDGTRNTEFDTRSNLCANPGDAGGRP
jgi:hypothetical protein